MQLRYIVEVSFASSELTNFQAWAKAHKVEAKQLTAEHVLCFISRTGNQLVFVNGYSGDALNVIASARYRLTKGTWNPMMLANYAAAVGLKLDGLDRFEASFKKAQKRKQTR